jgi:nitrate/TMAO reductase-like tetraheme cytochrome c subunit
MKKLILLSLLTFFSGSCSNMNEGYVVKGLSGKQLSLVFTHNINGETHPCGCRHFPLGGLPQVAGILHDLRAKNQVVFIDTGDTFFPSNNIPKSLGKSLLHTANNLNTALHDLKLDFYVLGEQDFSAGINWVKENNKNSKAQLLMSNLKKESGLNFKTWSKISIGPHQVYFLGILDPELLEVENRDLFTEPQAALQETLSAIKKDGYKEENPFHRLILLSHSGMDYDKILAGKIPVFDWIFGAHSQNFTQSSIDIGKTKIVQVLSRNHYLGHLKINLEGDKSKDSFELLESSDEKKDLLKPNPFIEFIDRHKTELSKIQEIEAQSMTSFQNTKELKVPTFGSCIECHDAQSKKWQSTAHSLAYTTLVKSNSANNPSCIGCHSVGFGKKEGFSNAKEIVEFHKSVPQEKLKNHFESYLKDFSQSFSQVGSLRKLAAKEISKHSQEQVKLDTKYKVDKNYAHVQCLNCHDKHFEHPFAMNEKKLEGKERFASIKNRCLECHTSDQSTHWYEKDTGGKLSKLNEKEFAKHYKAVACPLNE